MRLRPGRQIPTGLAAVLLSVALTACANGSRTADMAAAGGEAGDCVEGTLVVQALEVETTLYVSPDEGDAVRLLVDDAPLLTSLSGADLEVCGSMEEQGLAVDRFALISVDGYPAVLGTLLRRDAGWVLEPADGGSAVRLEAVPMALEEGVGQLLWVSGRYTDASTEAEPVLRVVAWGTPAG